MAIGLVGTDTHSDQFIEINKFSDSPKMKHTTTNHRFHGITTDAKHHEQEGEHSNQHSHDHNFDKISQMSETEVGHKLTKTNRFFHKLYQ